MVIKLYSWLPVVIKSYMIVISGYQVIMLDISSNDGLVIKFGLVIKLFSWLPMVIKLFSWLSMVIKG